MNNICPRCNGYMLDMHWPIGWKKCPTCAYCHDKNGENLVTKQTGIAALCTNNAFQGEADEPDQSKNAQDRSETKTNK